MNKESVLEVKLAITSAIGQIGKPDAERQYCVENLIKQFQLCKDSQNAQLKCMTVWTIGKLASV